MATRWAVATGNWSNTATWNGGTLPTSADDVHANTFTVTVDQNITVLSLRTTSATGVTAGGGFALGNGFTITCTGAGLVPGSSTCVTLSGTNSGTVSATCTASSTNTGITALATSSSGTLTVLGEVRGSSLNNGGNGVNMSNGSVTVTGNVFAGAGNNAHGIGMSGGTLAIVGNITGGFTTGQPTFGVLSVGGTSITITGNVTTVGTSGNYGVQTTNAATSIYVTGNLTPGTTGSGMSCISNTGNSTTKVISVIGTVSASIGPSGIGSHGVYDTNNAGGWTIVGGSLIDSAQGDCAVSARRFRCIPTLNTIRQHANNTGYPSGGSVVYGSLDYIPNNVPVPADVRSGVVYGNSSFTGTCAVPAAGSVALGVPVDNTTGTAVLTPAAVWDTLTSTMLTSGSIGERLSNCATVQTTGDQIAAANP